MEISIPSPALPGGKGEPTRRLPPSFWKGWGGLSFFIARRYLFSKKKHNVINIISGVSMMGVGIGTMALIVVMSAFNGLENLVSNLYSSFDPDIKITAKMGKTFDAGNFPKEKIKKIKGVKYFCESLEETVYLRYKENEGIAIITINRPDKLNALNRTVID